MFENVKEFIEKRIVGEIGVPYIDVIVKQNHSELFRYVTGKDGDFTGKEKLVMYSMSKPVTAFCVAKLVEEGKLSVLDKVTKYLPEFENVFLLDEKGNAVKPKTEMLIKHLLTMSAGFDYDFATPELVELFDRTEDQCTTREIIDALIKRPLHFEPGAAFNYSLCMDVMGEIVAIASGSSLSEYAKKVVFEPLGMRNSTFSNKEITANDCYKVYTAERGRIEPSEPFRREFVTLPNMESGGAGLKSTVEDYSVFADMLACHGHDKFGNQLLDSRILSDFTTAKVGEVSVQKTFGCIQGKDYDYGFGVRVRKVDTPWGLKVGEYGWDGAFGSYLMVDPRNGISVVIGLNIGAWPNVFGEHLNVVKEIYKNLKLD